MTKYFLKDLDETPLSGAGGKTRTFITRFGLVNKICTYISKKYFSIKLLLDKSRVLTVVRPRQNYCGFLFIAAAMEYRACSCNAVSTQPLLNHAHS